MTIRFDEELLEHIHTEAMAHDPALTDADAVRLIIRRDLTFSMCGIVNRMESTFQQVLRLLCGECSECNEREEDVA